MKKLFSIIYIFAFFIGNFTSAQEPPPQENSLGPTTIFCNLNKASIGTFSSYRFTGIVAEDNTTAIGLVNDYSIGNFCFFGKSDDSTNTLLGIKYYPSYNNIEITAPLRIYQAISLENPFIKIGGLQAGNKTASLAISGRPIDADDAQYPIGSIMFDDTFIYIRTSTGRWKRAALFDADF